MKTSSHSALRATELSIGYRAKKKAIPLVQDIDFTLNEGELAAIVGANGIGKSTLLRTLANMQVALSGSIRLKEKPLSAYSDIDLAKCMSVVLTEPLVSKNMTVAETVALGRQPYTNWIGSLTANDISKIKEVIKIVALEPIQNKKCFELSDGQLQRVMIARALAQDTDIILLDEPTTHLDLHHKVQVLTLLRTIAKETKKTILFTSHEIELAIQLCDKMLLMSTGHVSFGSPEALINISAFNTLFPSESIRFDKLTRKFQIIN